MKIKDKLLIAFVIPILLLGLPSLVGLQWSKILFFDFTQNSVTKVQTVLRIDMAESDLARNTLMYYLTQKSDEKTEFTENVSVMQEQLALYKTFRLSDEEKQALATVNIMINRGIDIKKKLFEIADQDIENNHKIRNLLENKIEPLFYNEWHKALTTNDPEFSAKKEALLAIELRINRVITEEKDYRLYHNPESKKNALDDLTDAKQRLKQLSQLNLNKQELFWFNQLQEYVNELSTVIDNIFQVVNTEYTFLIEDEKLSNELDIPFGQLKTVAVTEEQAVAQKINNLSYIITGILSLIILVSIVISFFFTHYLMRPINYLLSSIARIRKGENVLVERLSADEVGDLSESFGELVSENNTQVEKINAENWLKGHIAEILKAVQIQKNIEDMCDIAISKTAEAVDAGCGAFYVVQEQDNVKFLTLLGSYAYKKRKNISNQFKFGEGLVGQAALEGKIILLTDVPDDYIHITSGLGDKRPALIIVLPIKTENKILGVIEIASFHEITDAQQQFLEQLSSNLGLIIEAIQNRQKTELALVQVQQQSEELQTQQEELRATNEELMEKSRSLQESETELKTQSEELQASNEELEEKTERLAKQNASIGKQNKEIEQARADLEQRAKDLALASQYKSEFLANMSHELRTPLNSLLILSKNLQENKDGNLTDKQIESARVIYSGGKELLTLINDILDLSKVEAGHLQLDVTETSIKQICGSLKSQFEPVAKDKKIDFHIDISPDVPENIKTDEQRVLQIIKNLLSNAFKFTHLGSVTLSVAKPKPTVRFRKSTLSTDNALVWSVSDTGIGIPKAKQEAIFEAFQQADGSTSRSYGGTGLGLAISRALAELLGGEVDIESEEQKGSTFTLYLPLIYADKKNHIKEQTEHKTAKSTTVKNMRKIENIPLFLPDDRNLLPSKSKSLLIIEDDKNFAEIVMDKAKEKKYLCVVAGDGQSGLALATAYQPSGIVLDLGLPDIDGSEILTQLKSDLRTRHIPVHIISSRDETPDVRQKGAIGYFLKSSGSEGLSLVFDKIASVIDNEIKRVLVIEDNLDSQKAIVSLIDNPHIKIDCASTAKSAKEHIIQNNYDCIIVDLNLSDQSGYDLLKSLKKEKINLPPIIVYTGRELTEEEHEALQQYASSIILKGVSSPERLLDEVSLFLHSVESSLLEEQKKIIKTLHNPDKIFSNKRVLLVDDDMRNVFALSNILEERGLDVVIASNGKLALEKLSTEKGINIILMDIMMPIMDGYEAIKKIRGNPQIKNIPIIALTAKAMIDDKEKCLKAGANDYITKPVDVDQLISMIKVWLSE